MSYIELKNVCIDFPIPKSNQTKGFGVQSNILLGANSKVVLAPHP